MAVPVVMVAATATTHAAHDSMECRPSQTMPTMGGVGTSLPDSLCAGWLPFSHAAPCCRPHTGQPQVAYSTTGGRGQSTVEHPSFFKAYLETRAHAVDEARAAAPRDRRLAREQLQQHLSRVNIHLGTVNIHLSRVDIHLSRVNIHLGLGKHQGCWEAVFGTGRGSSNAGLHW